MLHDDVRACVLVGVLTVATALTGWPRANGIDEPRTAAAEVAEAKSPKKAERETVPVPPKVKAKSPQILLWPGSMFWGRPAGDDNGIVVHPIRGAAPKPREVQPPEYPMDKSNRARIKKVLEVAKQQLGDPYRYGAGGPDSFDCSGFTQFVWSHVGIGLAHSSSGQYASFPHVPLDQLKLGDLVYSPGHIGMYWGDGKMIHSPQTGGHVEIVPLHSNAVGGARILEREPTH